MKLIYVDSRARVSGTSTNFQISLREPIAVSEGQMMRIDQIRFPMTLTTVTESNRWLYTADSSYPPTVTYNRVAMELGTYNGQELATHIRARLAVVGLSVGTEWLTHSNGLRITFTGTMKIMTDLEIASLSEAVSPWMPTDSPRTFNDNLGTYTWAKAGGLQTITYPWVNLTAADTLYLCSRTLSNEACFGPRGNHDVLAKIVVDDPLGGIHRSDMPTNLYHRMPELTLKMIDFSLQDRHGGAVTLAGELSFVLSID
jgi:hypothetical protein